MPYAEIAPTSLPSAFWTHGWWLLLGQALWVQIALPCSFFIWGEQVFKIGQHIRVISFT